MTRARRGALAASWLAAALAPGLARAHMMPPGQATLNVLEDSVFQVVSVPASAVSDLGADEDGDGRLSPGEVAAHELALATLVGERFRVTDAEGAGRLELVMVKAEADDRSATSAAGAEQLLALLKTRFEGPPGALKLETDLFGGPGGGGQLLVRATRGAERETAVLDPTSPRHTFFGAGAAEAPLSGLVGVGAVAAAAVLVLLAAQARRRWRRPAPGVVADRPAALR